MVVRKQLGPLSVLTICNTTMLLVHNGQHRNKDGSAPTSLPMARAQVDMQKVTRREDEGLDHTFWLERREYLFWGMA